MSKAVVSLWFFSSFVCLTVCFSPTASAQTGEDAATLLTQIKNSSPDISKNARAALMQLDASATPALITALQDSDPTVRTDAAAALGEIGPEAPAAVPPLTETLRDRSDDVREAAASALEDIGPSAASAVPALVSALQDRDYVLRTIAGNALTKIGPPAVPALIAKFSVKDYDTSEAAGEVLQKFGAAAVPALIQALQNTDSRVSYQASYTLQHIGTQALPGLLDALSSPDDRVRQKIITTLGGLNSSHRLIAPVLERNLTDPASTVRLSAIDALDVIQTDLARSTRDEIASRFVSALGDSDPSVRAEAAKRLADFGPPTPTALSALMAAAQGADESMRGAALQSLSLTAPNTPGLVRLLIRNLKMADVSARTEAEQGLESIGINAVPALVTAATDQNPKVRLSVITALGRIADAKRRAIPVLILALADQSQAVRQAATEALLRSQGVSGEATISALTVALTDKNPVLRTGAAYTLGRLGNAATSAIPALKKASKDRVASVRLSAMEALQRHQFARTLTAAAGLVAAADLVGALSPQPSNDALISRLWPPPEPTLILPLPRQYVGKDSDPLRAIRERLRVVLSAAGYSDQSLMAAPDGFAVITRVEQIHPDGTCFADPYRFGLALPPITGSFLSGVRQYLHLLFSSNEQQFRMFVIVVTSHDVRDSGRSLAFEEAQKWLRQGGQVLPRSIGRAAFSGKNCYLLVYDFAYDRNLESPDLVLSPLPALTHCVKAGIMNALQGGQP